MWIRVFEFGAPAEEVILMRVWNTAMAALMLLVVVFCGFVTPFWWLRVLSWIVVGMFAVSVAVEVGEQRRG